VRSTWLIAIMEIADPMARNRSGCVRAAQHALRQGRIESAPQGCSSHNRPGVSPNR